MRCHTVIEVEGLDMPVIVHYERIPGRRGARDTLCGVRNAGPPLEPDEPPMIELGKITDIRGGEVELTNRQIETIYREIMDQDGE